MQPATTTLQDDAAFINAILSKLINKGKEVIVLVHSYGGMVGSEAIMEEMTKNYRAREGMKGGVVKLLYICAFLLHEGESLATPLGGQLPSYIPLEVHISST